MRWRDGLIRLADRAEIGARLVSQVLMAALTIVILVGVFWRYILQDAIPWAEETARYFMIWMGFLASGIALREGSHIAIENLLDALPARARPALVLAIRLLSLAFLVTVVVLGAMLLQRISRQTTPALGISMIWPYLAIPVGCLLMVIELVGLMLRDPYGRVRATDPLEHGGGS